MRIDDLRERFVWTADSRDEWTVLRGDGPLRGDCDDFAVTALMCEVDIWPRWWWAVLTRQAEFWWCRANGEGHLMLHYKPRGWIDNQNPRWSETPGFEPIKRFNALVVARRLTIGR